MVYTVLALETSCDECAAAVVTDGRDLRASVVASQAPLHARYGGVVPELAGREHLRSIVPVLEQTLTEAGLGWEGIDALAVTQGPGLSSSLLVGVNAAKAVAWARELPLIPIHHIEGHLYANWLAPALAEQAERQGTATPPAFPLVCLVVSGGHTELLLMRGHGDFQRLGETLDDAAGEAFDKVGRLLGLPFPGGPAIERAAREAVEPAAPLPRAWLRGSYDFSFSGIKTAVRRRLEQDGAPPLAAAEAAPGQAAEAETEAMVASIALEFQTAVVDVLATKTARAAAEEGAREVIVAGGVAANGALREALRARCPVPVRVPPPGLCTDNAAMIGAAAYYKRPPDGARQPLDFDLFSASGEAVFSAGGS